MSRATKIPLEASSALDPATQIPPSSSVLSPATRLRRSNCPLRNDLNLLKQHQQGMLTSLRRLRRDLQYCQTCQRFNPGAPCPVMETFNAQVAGAIRAISNEFNRT
jgi:hypothetical protein